VTIFLGSYYVANMAELLCFLKLCSWQSKVIKVSSQQGLDKELYHYLSLNHLRQESMVYTIWNNVAKNKVFRF
jgi:Na+-transporting NADH:ubiquinone oxidoreductase subunit NqrE